MADLIANAAGAYRQLAAFGVTTRRAPYILERARGTGRVDGHRECGEDPYTVTWTPGDGYTITEPQPEKAGTT